MNKYRKAMKGKGRNTVKKLSRMKLKGLQTMQWNALRHRLRKREEVIKAKNKLNEKKETAEHNGSK